MSREESRSKVAPWILIYCEISPLSQETVALPETWTNSKKANVLWRAWPSLGNYWLKNEKWRFPKSGTLIVHRGRAICHLAYLRSSLKTDFIKQGWGLQRRPQIGSRWNGVKSWGLQWRPIWGLHLRLILWNSPPGIKIGPFAVIET